MPQHRRWLTVILLNLCDLAFVNPIQALPIGNKVLDSRTTHRPRGRSSPPTASNALQRHDLFHTFRETTAENQVNETAILVHDFLTDSRLSTPLINAPSLQRYTLLSYNMRGFERSPDPHAPYSRPDYIHSLHPYPAHIIVSELGGVLALEYALSHPDYVTSVSVIRSGLPEHRWTQQSFMDFTKARTVRRFLDSGAHLQGRERDLVQRKQMFITSNKAWDVLRNGSRKIAKALIEMATAYRGFRFFGHDEFH